MALTQDIQVDFKVNKMCMDISKDILCNLVPVLQISIVLKGGRYVARGVNSRLHGAALIENEVPYVIVVPYSSNSAEHQSTVCHPTETIVKEI